MERSGFSDTTTVAAPAAGTITRLRGEGDTVTRGRSLMSIDAKATAWVLYGMVPMYRDLGPGAADGSDVRQLERNLKALGYDPGTVDDDWTSDDHRRGHGLPGRSRPHPERDAEALGDRGQRRPGACGQAQRGGRRSRARRRAGGRAHVDHAGGHGEARRRPGRRRPRRRSRAGHAAGRQRGRRPQSTRVGTVAAAGENGSLADRRAARRVEQPPARPPRRRAGQRLVGDGAYARRARGAR